MITNITNPARPTHTIKQDDESSKIPPILRLPPELFDTLLHHVNPEDLQSTALALSRVFPDHPISRTHLWRHVIARSKGQMMPMWRKMKEMGGKGREGPEATRTFSMETWKGDADILNNVLRCLPDLRVLMLNVGTNFSPEHLVEMFEEPRLGIRRMEMRFRPYVEQATYYQFLKGSYFDTAIETIYRHWPAVASFTHLSIVQDPPPRQSAPPTVVQSLATTAANSQLTSLSNSMTDLTLTSDETSAQQEQDHHSTPPTSADESVEKGYTGHGPFPYLSERMGDLKPKSFAQPIVFFDIKCVARFGASPVASTLTHLRFRVPSRDIASVLVGPGGTGGLFPALRYLDISTTNLRLDSVFTSLLKAYVNLEHLVLDRVNLFGFMAKDSGEDLCRDLGGMCVSAGLARGKDRERRIAAWEVGERTRMAQAEADRRAAIGLTGSRQNHDDDDSDDEDGAPPDTAAIEAAAQAAERDRQIAIARARRGHRSAGHSNISLRDRPLRAGRGGSVTTLQPSIPLPPQDILYLVLPPLPTLKTICIGGEAHGVSSKRLPQWDDEFHIGWREGLAKVLGWAGHVADRYERALRKAEEWRIQEIQGPIKTTVKGKSKAGPAPVKTRPPLDIRLLRFPFKDEVAPYDPSDPISGLIEIDATAPRDYLTPYHQAIAEAESYANDRSRPAPCILCTVPDCEGPSRRGAEPLERVDGRGGMDGAHRPGCGHAIGRSIWGWEGVEP